MFVSGFWWGLGFGVLQLQEPWIGAERFCKALQGFFLAGIRKRASGFRGLGGAEWVTPFANVEYISRTKNYKVILAWGILSP